MAPQHLQARSIDAALSCALCAGPLVAQVHSVFDRAVNLQHASGEIFSLASCKVDNAPQTAIVDIAGFGDTGIQVGDVVTVGVDRLHVGDCVVVHWATASVWQAILPLYPGNVAGMVGQLRAARACTGRLGVQAGQMKQGDFSSLFAREVEATLEQRSTLLIDTLTQGRLADAGRHAVSLIGLGPGLTPSGDDFLVGLFAVLNLAGSPCHGWLDGGRHVLPQAAHLTNAVSLAALTTAADGQVRESVVALIDELLHGTPATLAKPLRRVLAIGASSGADMVAGILAGLELNLRVGALRSNASTSRTSLTAARGSCDSHAAVGSAVHSTGA